MKHLLFIAFFLLQANALFAQDSSSTKLQPVAGDKVMTIGLINNSAFWAYKKYKTDKLAYRFGINGYYSINPKSSTNGTTTNSGPYFYNIYKSQNSSSTKSSAFSIGISAGFQKGIANYKRIEPYMGLDFGINYSYSKREEESTSPAGYYLYQKNTTINPLSINFNVLPLVGLNYYITPGMALGAEYRLNVASVNYSANGNSLTEVYKSGPNYSLLHTKTETKEEGGTFSFNGQLTGTGYITLTFFLR